MPKTITLTPNYAALYRRFMDVAMGHMNVFSDKRRATFTRKEVYDFVAAFRIALGSLTSAEEIKDLREGFGAVAEKIFTTLEEEQAQVEPPDDAALVDGVLVPKIPNFVAVKVGWKDEGDEGPVWLEDAKGETTSGVCWITRSFARKIAAKMKLPFEEG